MNRELLKKYDVPVPRYTSYPTVPYWSETPTATEWISSLRSAFSRRDSTWSLYIHIPFCESLCTYCGCNTVITRNHEREPAYIQTVLAEFALYLKQVPELTSRPLAHLHLGGGTPTFLSAKNLSTLIKGLLGSLQLSDQFVGSVEVDPRHTDVEQLKLLRSLQFNRVSMGVQDFDPEVQRLVNRLQPFAITRDLTQAARDLGYTSVNFDLIYGLPKQTPESFARTIEQTLQLRPDRIALYSLAKVPWIKPAQRLFKDADLPEGADKRALFEAAFTRFQAAGYVDIGMDHFALKTDALSAARQNGTLHRNFMGYTEHRTDVLLGLGVSSISETHDIFHQNEKVLPVYERRVTAGELPTLRGHKLTKEDQQHREQILQFMTRGEVQLHDEAQVNDLRQFLHGMIEDGLVTLEKDWLRLTPAGQPFLRNACVALDQRLRRQKPETRIFSQAL